MIDRYQLRYFLGVVELGNFSRAAVRMNVTQPTLSAGIAKLEQELGARLFFRNSQRVELTEAGVRFLDHARAIEREFHALEATVKGPEPARLVRLGVLGTIPTALLSRIIAANRASDEPDRLEIIEGAERDLISRLQRRRIDLALCILRPGDARFAQKSLYREGFSLALSDHHRLASRTQIGAEELADEVMIVRRHCDVLTETSRHFTERGVRPAFSYRTTNDDKAVAMVRAQLGITVMPDSYCEPGVVRVPLTGFEFQREIGLMALEQNRALLDHQTGLVAAITQIAAI
jgi:DNA-binding transcriptional LysR family regulator